MMFKLAIQSSTTRGTKHSSKSESVSVSMLQWLSIKFAIGAGFNKFVAAAGNGYFLAFSEPCIGY